MLAAKQSGLLSEKGGRIGGRVSQALVRQAKRQTGIETDTDLIEFALATVALEDNFASSLIAGQGLLLDTCVYIDQMQDRSPQVLDDLIAQQQVNHSTVAIQELMHTVGVLNPSDARTASVVDVIGKQIKAMPPIGSLRRT
ncbi:type II toxin-antitoxin system VapC family toxin [Bradyrhizobium hereditatis]|uniref:type II toxin-antitoxin system VapC family toxin n=1 Tax=Bradyrhizobium hereditatis TaxID=2821405 RepID=UPI001CE2C349|nr:hypothetical protein [Bradyrhizobium hereditatis]